MGRKRQFDPPPAMVAIRPRQRSFSRGSSTGAFGQKPPFAAALEHRARLSQKTFAATTVWSKMHLLRVACPAASVDVARKEATMDSSYFAVGASRAARFTVVP